MRIHNILQTNDWEISKFLKLVITIQIAVLALVILDGVNIHIPILREAMALIYLTFVPGILILRILRLHNLGNIETLLYSVGLSITSLMLIGLFMNMVYPLLGILGPISLPYLTATITGMVLMLSVLSYWRDKDYSKPNFIDIKDMMSPGFLSLCLIPFLAIFGSYLVNFYDNTFVLIFLIFLIGFVAILAAYDKIPLKYYPFTIFILSLSLAYHSSLVSMHLWGWDVQTEQKIAQMVIDNAYWYYNLNFAYNAMLSISILAPIFSIISTMSVTWIFKIVYPFLLSLLPLGLYVIYHKQTSAKIAFLASFLFLSSYLFLGELLTLARQQIGELFLMLLVLLIITKMTKVKKEVLFLVFGFSLVVSHYTSTYLFIILLLGGYILLFLAQRLKKGDLLLSNEKNGISSDLKDRSIGILILFLAGLAMAWYNLIARSTAFNPVLNLFKLLYTVQLKNLTLFVYKIQIWQALLIFIILGVIVLLYYRFKQVKNRRNNFYIKFKSYLPYISTGFYVMILLVLMVSNKNIYICLMWIVVFFTLIGLSFTLTNVFKTKFNGEYLALAIVSFIIIIVAFLVPLFADTIRIERIFHFSLIFFAPFGVIGGIKLYESFLETFKLNKNFQMPFKIFTIFLVLYLFINTTFMDKFFLNYFPIKFFNTTFSTLYLIVIFIAPLVFLGLIKFYKMFAKNFTSKLSQKEKSSLKIFILILLVFIFFYTGLPNQIGHLPGGSIALYPEGDNAKFNDMEHDGANWLYQKKGRGKIFADHYGQVLFNYYFLTFGGGEKQIKSWGVDKLQNGFYIYLRSSNVLNNNMLVRSKLSVKGNTQFYVYYKPFKSSFLEHINKIYENGGSDIYLT